MSELVCAWCGVGNPAGSAACGACGASLQPQSPAQSEPPEPGPPAEPAVEPPAPEPPVARAVERPVQPAVPEAPASSPDGTSRPLAGPQSPAPAPVPATGAPSGSRSGNRWVACPNKLCPGVIDLGDGYCPVCKTQFPVAPPSPAGAKPSGGGFHIPRGVWVVLAILPLVTCAAIAAVVLSSIGAPPDVVEPGDIPGVQKEAERVAWPSGTPTRAPTVTRTATRTVTPTGTPTTTPTAAAVAPIVTVSSHATYTPLPVVTPVPALPAGTSTVSLQGNLFTGAKVYMKSTGEYLFEILGRAVDCPKNSGNPVGAAYKTRLPNTREQWTPENSMQVYASSGAWVVRAEDPALKTKQLAQLTGCQ
jgi:hypothetical protein